MIGSPTASIDARHSGTFSVGGALEINRLGFGAMRITGRGIWGPPADEAEALRTLKHLPQLGVNFIDPTMLPIPGTSKVVHLEENVAAASITLTDAEFAALDRAGR